MIAALNHAGDSDSSGCPVTEKDSKMFRNLRMRWELRRGRALDVWSSGEYPSDLYPTWQDMASRLLP